MKVEQTKKHNCFLTQNCHAYNLNLLNKIFVNKNTNFVPIVQCCCLLVCKKLEPQNFIITSVPDYGYTVCLLSVLHCASESVIDSGS